MWSAFLENRLLHSRLHLLYRAHKPFFYFISDTVGNLIAFSDGTFSGETAGHDEVEMVELPKTTASIIFMVTAPESQRYYNRLDRCYHNLCQ